MRTTSFRSAGGVGAGTAPFTTRVGSYEIVRELAQGGMAELLLARARGPQGFEKVVVIKKILPHLAEDPRFVQLFLDEAKVAACLDHPNIAQVTDVGMLDGQHCFVMEYVHGRDLRQILRHVGALPIEHAVLIARDLTSALHHVHTRRSSEGVGLDIVHRDVSPSNIAVSFDGMVKLLDFGVAKASTSSIHTRTGVVTGKASYMSPEQARGERLDRRSDVYSIGIVLWEMVTGRGLYRADTELATAQLVVERMPEPPSRWQTACPRELDDIILRALSHDRDTRYQTARELQIDLEGFAREHALWVSTAALGDSMHAWFEDDLRAEHDAQAGRATLDDWQFPEVTTDPVTSSLPRRTTPSGRVLQLVPPAVDSVTRVMPRPPSARVDDSVVTTPAWLPTGVACGEITIDELDEAPEPTRIANPPPPAAPRTENVRVPRRWLTDRRLHLAVVAALIAAIGMAVSWHRDAEPVPVPEPAILVARPPAAAPAPPKAPPPATKAAATAHPSKGHRPAPRRPRHGWDPDMLFLK